MRQSQTAYLVKMTKLPSYIAGLNEMKTVNVLFPLEKGASYRENAQWNV